jgi:hypothetical protein
VYDVAMMDFAINHLAIERLAGRSNSPSAGGLLSSEEP